MIDRPRNLNSGQMWIITYLAILFKTRRVNISFKNWRKNIILKLGFLKSLKMGERKTSLLNTYGRITNGRLEE
jgi:hypothetical protein